VSLDVNKEIKRGIDQVFVKNDSKMLSMYIYIYVYFIGPQKGTGTWRRVTAVSSDEIFSCDGCNVQDTKVIKRQSWTIKSLAL